MASAVADRWKPNWEVAKGDGDRDAGPPRLRIESSAELLSLGPGMRQSSSGLTAVVQQPVYQRFSAIVLASSRHSLSTSGGVSLQTPRNGAGAAGAAFRDEIGKGTRLDLAVLAGWDGQPGSWTRAGITSGRGSLTVTGWAGGERQSHLALVGDSLGEIGTSTEARGAEVEGSLSFRIGDLRLRPGVSFSRESIGSGTSGDRYFLVADAEGRAGSSAFVLAAERGDFGVRARYWSRKIDLGSPITRTSQSAGRLSFARMRYATWSVEAHRQGDGRTLALDLTGERVEAGLSARLETWPYASLWEVMAAQAFRLDGTVEAEALRARLRGDPVAAGWEWSGSIARYGLRSNYQSWYVTGLGFGRSGEKTSTAVVSPAYTIGGSLARPLPFGEGTVTATFSVEVPIYARQLETASASSRSTNGSASPRSMGEHAGVSMGGYAGIKLTWIR